MKPTKSYRDLATSAGLFAGALAIRLIGIDFGLPYLYHWDEPVFLAVIRRFLVAGDALPHFYDYPSGYFFLQFVFAPISYLVYVCQHGYRPSSAMALADFVLVGRLVTAVAGALTPALVYAFAVRFWRDRGAGVLAGALLALSPLPAMDSRYLTTDMALAAAAFATAYLFFVYDDGRRRRALLAAAVMAGAAAAIKYNGAFFGMVAFAWLAFGKRGPKPVLTFAGIAALSFVALNPGIIIEPDLFFADTLFIFGHYFVAGNVGPSAGLSAGQYFMQLWFHALTPVPVLCALAGVIILLSRDRRRGWLFISFPAAYGVFLFFTKVYYNRGLEPVMPFLCLAAGLAGATVWRRVAAVRRRWLAVPALVGITVAFFYRPVVLTARESLMLTKVDRRTEAKGWFEAAVPWPARVAKEALNPSPLDAGGQVETPPIDPDKYEVHASHYLVDRSAAAFAAAGTVYLMTPNLYENFTRFAAAYPEREEEGRRNYESILNHSELVFYSPREVRFDFRPPVEIYRLEDEFLRRRLQPSNVVNFKPDWVRSEADPAIKMAAVPGGFRLEAPARAGAVFTVPAEACVIEVRLGAPRGTPEVAVEVDGVAAAHEKVRGAAVVRTRPLRAPPYVKHLAVRCVGPPGSYVVLSGASVRPAD
ncbi:MAG: glycosyltransferase family 39 protein [Candidatus Coatesbacteria bacterium]|nr:MAG: glycosyltransferase family 39 protein [Candidatus Coatesbacteria bacterium]